MINIFEQSIRIVQWFFGILVTLSLTHFFRDQSKFFNENTWPALLVCTALFLRYSIGSANHMYYEYLKKTEASLRRKSLRLMKDFAFIATFGFMALKITDTDNVKTLFFYILVLLTIAILWSILDKTVSIFLALIGKDKNKTGNWEFWLCINLAQTVMTLIAYIVWDKYGGFSFLGWSIVLEVLCILYIVLLIWDCLKQFQLLAEFQNETR